MQKDFKKRFWISLLVASIILIWLDFFVGSLLVNKKPLLFGIYDVSFLGYSGFVYPLFLISFWVIPLIVYPKMWRLWFIGFLVVWTLNDLLWFIVRPDEWIRFWIPKGKVLFEYKIIGDFYIPIVDYLAAPAILLRILVIIVLYNKWFREGRVHHESAPMDIITE